MSRADRRLIPRDACTWCGHQHPATPCTAAITIATKPHRTAPCPCRRTP